LRLTRRDLLRSAAWLALAPVGCVRPAARPRGVELNDVHSTLNSTWVERVERPATAEELRRLVRRAAARGEILSLAGGRHAMGGQQFGSGTVHVDTRGLARVLAFDAERGHIEVEAGIQWPELIAGYLARQEGAARPWGIAQKQTGADRLTLGGSVSCNAHGRGLTFAPLVGDVEALRLLDTRGEWVTASRAENPELFRLAVGGYGLFGLVASLTLRLVPRRKLERVVEVIELETLPRRFAERIAAGVLYGDFQFAIDPRSDDFLRRGVFSCYRPVTDETPMPATQRELADEDWQELLVLAHTDKRAAFERYATYYLSTSGQLYWSDTHQLAAYLDGYHEAVDRRLQAKVPGSEMISELYVPRADLPAFMAAAADDLRAHGDEVIYGTIRLIERDAESFLPWARESWGCVIFNLHIAHSPEGRERAARAFRRLIDLALVRRGSYYLTYHRWATREQVLAAHPRFPEFLAKKLEHDPEERFQSDWYRHMKRLIGT
jgi:FAD/FMN-containing dehydrogenase